MSFVCLKTAFLRQLPYVSDSHVTLRKLLKHMHAPDKSQLDYVVRTATAYACSPSDISSVVTGTIRCIFRVLQAARLGELSRREVL